jgi:WD40 repeat protein
MISGEERQSVEYPSKSMGNTEYSHSMLSHSYDHSVANTPLKYSLLLSKCLLPTTYKRSLPFVSLVENEEETVIFTAFGSMIEVRNLQQDNSMSLLQLWPLADNELICCMDTKRTETNIYFSVGSINGIVYVFDFPSNERVVFKNHSDKITNVKFCPAQEKNLILTSSKD